jgi:hypothetical protein
VTALQRHTRKGWSTLQRVRTDQAGRYTFRLASSSASAFRYRVVTRADSRHQAGVSSSFTVKILACQRMSAPSGGRAAWFTRPGLKSRSQIASSLARLFCSAARGSTVNVSMYFIRSGSGQWDTNEMLQSLERVARYRGVKVRILVEGKIYRQSGTSFRATLNALRRYATVVQCQLGCRDEAYHSQDSGPIMHHKFVSMSDLTWSGAQDPAVVMSSANWSQAQLRTMWQSAVLAYRDPSLHHEVEAQWRVLNACAGRGGCASWNATLTNEFARDAYGMAKANGVWHDTAESERRGKPGSGVGVTFSPTRAADPVAAALRQYTCTPQHRTVRVVHMFLSHTRTSVVNALGELRDQGCDVRVILSTRGAAPVLGAGALRNVGAQVSCTPRIHDKAFLIDAVRVADGRPDKSVLMGSQSLSARALRNNDESLMRLSTHDATGASASANAAVWNAYNKHWSAMLAQKRACE